MIFFLKVHLSYTSYFLLNKPNNRSNNRVFFFAFCMFDIPVFKPRIFLRKYTIYNIKRLIKIDFEALRYVI